MGSLLPALLASLVAASFPSVGPPRTPATPSLFPGVQKLIWIGAHPDDEVLLAPTLARLCLRERVACHFLVLTRGEAGICLLPSGCEPDVATVRAHEMQAAAALFSASLTQWTLPDGGGTTGWSAASGGHSALLSRLRAFIEEQDPDLILTFDPRHGSTCHGDHRSAGELVIEAYATLLSQPALVLLETRATVTAAPPFVRFAPAGTVKDGLFADAATSDIGDARGTWSYAAADAALHASQFANESVTALRRMRPQERVVYFAPAAMALDSDEIFTCP